MATKSELNSATPPQLRSTIPSTLVILPPSPSAPYRWLGSNPVRLYAIGVIVQVGNDRYRFVRSIGRKVAFATLILAFLTGFTTNSLAQKSEKSTRKVISTVKPAYPQTLKNLHIEGLVRLKATVLPNGTVSDIQVIGGNPILVESAVKALKNWKYAPAPSQTEEEVVLNFFDR
jgi:TonB family protein